jgi:predicted DNA-binding antitoxin AbrB/MazE fold protein
MTEVITAIYEQRVLRPLTPLHLPEHTRVEIQVAVQAATGLEAHQRVRAALQATGLAGDTPADEKLVPVSEEQLAAAAQALGEAGPLSELIIAEREGR